MSKTFSADVPKQKGYYCTKKRAIDYINSYASGYKSLYEFRVAVKGAIKDLSLYPKANQNQIRFYRKVAECLKDEVNTKYLNFKSK